MKELLVEADDSLIERVVSTGASFDDIAQAVDDLEVERSSGVPTMPASRRIAELRKILHELVLDEDHQTIPIAGERL